MSGRHALDFVNRGSDIVFVIVTPRAGGGLLRRLGGPRRKRVAAFGIVSDLSIDGTATVLQIDTDDADKLWQRAIVG